MHQPGAISLSLRDKGWRGDKGAVEVLADVDLLGGGSAVEVLLSGHDVNGFSFTLDRCNGTHNNANRCSGLVVVKQHFFLIV